MKNKNLWIFAGLVVLAIIVGHECYRQMKGEKPALPWLTLYSATDKAAAGRSSRPNNPILASMN